MSALDLKAVVQVSRSKILSDPQRNPQRPKSSNGNGKGVSAASSGTSRKSSTCTSVSDTLPANHSECQAAAMALANERDIYKGKFARRQNIIDRINTSMYKELCALKQHLISKHFADIPAYCTGDLIMKIEDANDRNSVIELNEWLMGEYVREKRNIERFYQNALAEAHELLRVKDDQLENKLNDMLNQRFSSYEQMMKKLSSTLAAFEGLKEELSNSQLMVTAKEARISELEKELETAVTQLEENKKTLEELSANPTDPSAPVVHSSAMNPESQKLYEEILYHNQVILSEMAERVSKIGRQDEMTTQRIAKLNEALDQLQGEREYLRNEISKAKRAFWRLSQTDPASAKINAKLKSEMIRAPLLTEKLKAVSAYVSIDRTCLIEQLESSKDKVKTLNAKLTAVQDAYRKLKEEHLTLAREVVDEEPVRRRTSRSPSASFLRPRSSRSSRGGSSIARIDTFLLPPSDRGERGEMTPDSRKRVTSPEDPALKEMPFPEVPGSFARSLSLDIRQKPEQIAEPEQLVAEAKVKVLDSKVRTMLAERQKLQQELLEARETAAKESAKLRKTIASMRRNTLHSAAVETQTEIHFDANNVCIICRTPMVDSLAFYLKHHGKDEAALVRDKYGFVLPPADSGRLSTLHRRIPRAATISGMPSGFFSIQRSSSVPISTRPTDPPLDSPSANGNSLLRRAASAGPTQPLLSPKRGESSPVHTQFQFPDPQCQRTPESARPVRTPSAQSLSDVSPLRSRSHSWSPPGLKERHSRLQELHTAVHCHLSSPLCTSCAQGISASKSPTASPSPAQSPKQGARLSPRGQVVDSTKGSTVSGTPGQSTLTLPSPAKRRHLADCTRTPSKRDVLPASSQGPEQAAESEMGGSVVAGISSLPEEGLSVSKRSVCFSPGPVVFGQDSKTTLGPVTGPKDDKLAMAKDSVNADEAGVRGSVPEHRPPARSRQNWKASCRGRV
eukprot:RCo017133